MAAEGRAFLDEGVGETRLVRVDAEGRPVALTIARASDDGAVALFGETYAGRVRAVEPSLHAAFVDIGVGAPGFLAFKGKRAHAGLVEGAGVRVEIAAEAAPGKGPRLRRLPDGAGVADAPRRLTPAASLAVEAGDVVRGDEARAAADLAVEIAASRVIALAGGGDLAIEPARGLVAIDVDGGAQPPRAVNPAAAEEAARQIALRGLSGLVMIDFAGAPDRAAGAALRASVLAHLSAFGVKAEAALVSRFGVLELAVERRRRAVHEMLFEPDGSPRVDAVAFDALRALEREGAADRGARLVLTVAPPVAAWLADHELIWRAGLTDRLGARFTVTAAPEPERGAAPDFIDVARES